ncbi:MAG TPA: prolyl oligopeptidase family serine peptidase, partial [Labilithrix sp.]|nr:prolyl oligopeptidase family serine peptidase [Labilithrix sp.]
MPQRLRKRAHHCGIALGLFTITAEARANLSHETVSGSAIENVTIERANATPAHIRWAELSSPKAPGLVTVRFRARGRAALVPHCNGRERVLVDGAVRDRGSKGPIVLRLDDEAPHEIAIEVKASTYEKRIACSEPPRVGSIVQTTDGLSVMRFTSPHAAKGGGEAVVFVPPGHDRTKPAKVLLGTHPWNGTPWTYAAYAELLDAAAQRDVVLLMPSGLGNSLYVADAEDEVMRALDALGGELAVDPKRVSIWGASMGGAGATTIAFHRPDRFASVASFFGDSSYDLSTYVKAILGDRAGARRVNALDVLENARHLPVFLVHGEEDRVSPMKQSTMLFDAMTKAGFKVELERVAKMGHEGPLVVRYIRQVVDRAASVVAPSRPPRVSFRSVRSSDTEAYGIKLVRAGAGDAFVDLERREDGVHVLAAQGVVEIVLARDALGANGKDDLPIRFDTTTKA